MVDPTPFGGESNATVPHTPLPSAGVKLGIKSLRSIESLTFSDPENKTKFSERDSLQANRLGRIRGRVVRGGEEIGMTGSGGRAGGMG